MTEFYTVRQIDNSRVVRPVASHRMREYGRRLLMGAVLTACTFLYAWQHFQCIQLRCQLEELQAQQTQQAELNQQLRLEIASLSSPMRIDAIARQQLGLTVPAPSQGMPAEAPSDAELAQAHVLVQPARP